jgi:hypothetical protein
MKRDNFTEKDLQRIAEVLNLDEFSLAWPVSRARIKNG